MPRYRVRETTVVEYEVDGVSWDDAQEKASLWAITGDIPDDVMEGAVTSVKARVFHRTSDEPVVGIDPNRGAIGPAPMPRDPEPGDE